MKPALLTTQPFPGTTGQSLLCASSSATSRKNGLQSWSQTIPSGSWLQGSLSTMTACTSWSRMAAQLDHTVGSALWDILQKMPGREAQDKKWSKLWAEAFKYQGGLWKAGKVNNPLKRLELKWVRRTRRCFGVKLPSCTSSGTLPSKPSF